jgi:hypothetical protein
MRARPRRAVAAFATLALVAALGPAIPAAAVEPGQVVAAAKAAYQVYQYFDDEFTLEEAAAQITAAINQARTEIEAHFDAIAAAEVKACATAALGDLVDVPRMSPDTLQDFARDASNCAHLAGSMLEVVTDQSTAAMDQLGFALNIVGPIALVTRVAAGLTTPTLRSALIRANRAVLDRLRPACSATPLWGDSGGVLVEVELRCRAFNRQQGFDSVVLALRRGQPLPPLDYSRAIEIAMRGTSYEVAGGVLPILTATPRSTAVARNADGRMVLFAIDGADRVWYRTQTAAGSEAWTAWRLFDATLSRIAAKVNNVGAIEVFGVDTAGRLWHRWQLEPNRDAWSAWDQFGGGSPRFSTVTVTRWRTSLNVYGIIAGGQILGTTQYAGPAGGYGGRWSDWLPLDGPMSAIAIQGNGYQRVELFGLDAAGRVRHRWELPTGGWSPWADFGLGLPPVRTIATTTFGAGEGVVVYVTTSAGQLYERIQYSAPTGGNGGGTWSGWLALGGGLSEVTPTTDSAGLVELFGVDGSGTLWHRRVLPEGGWSTWLTLDGP